MRQQATFADWDFANVWAIFEDRTYPYLRWRLPADLNCDGRVNMEDMAILCAHWQEEKQGYLPGDLNHDHRVDEEDLVLFCVQWLARTV